MHSETLRHSNESTAAGFTETEVFVTTNSLPYSESYSSDTTICSDCNVTNVTLQLTTAAGGGSFVSRAVGDGGSSSRVITELTVSCVTCIVVLLVIIAVITWRCRAVQQHSGSTHATAVPLEADKYGAFLLLPFTHIVRRRRRRFRIDTEVCCVGAHPHFLALGAGEG